MNLVFNRPTSHKRTNLASLIDEFFTNEFQAPTVKKTPKVNIVETKETHELSFAIPGFNKEDFSIDIEADQLTVSGEVKKSEETKEENFVRQEFNYTSFKRSFTLPDTVDITGIEAKYENGILNVTLPKKEEAKTLPPRKVKIA